MTAGRMAGWFDAAQDLDWYRLELPAGQRIHVELQGGRLGDLRPLAVLLAPDGTTLQLTPAMHAGPADLQAFSAVAPQAGAYSLVVAAPSVSVPADTLPLAYMLSVSAVAADAEPDRHADAWLLAPDQPRSASFDQTGDRDSYAVDLAAGQRVLFEAQGIGLQVSSFGARLYGPGDRDLGLAVSSSLSQVRFVTRADEAGRYTLELQSRTQIGGPATTTPVGYTVTARLLPADDHPDGVGAAEPLAVGSTARGVLDLPGDLDAFRFDLDAGQRYLFELASPTATGSVVSLRLYDIAGQLLREGRAAPGAASALSFEPEASGSYVLRAEAPLSVTAGALGDGLFELRSATLATDALPSRLATAPTVELGVGRELVFDQPTDLDVLRFFARAGERFGVAMTTAAGAPAAAALAVVDDPGALPARLDDRSSGTLAWTARQDGWQYLLVAPSAAAAASGAIGGSFTIAVDAHPADDHGDVPAVGTRITVGQPVAGRLDLGSDVDWFRVELQAGHRYHLSLRIPDADLAIGVAPDLLLTDTAGRDLYAARLGPRTAAADHFVFTPEQSGTYALRPAGVASYTLRVDAVAADDVSDRSFSAPTLDLAPTYQALGMDVQGGEAAEGFVGGSRADVFRGGGGDDVFVGGAGDDRFEGGTGADLARYPGQRGDYRIEGGSGAWTVRDVAGALGTDTLVSVERLGFDGASKVLALDLDGHAGTVAKLIGALFGPGWLQRADIVGVGLALLDDGWSPLQLAQAAVASSLFTTEAGSSSNRDFVVLVYTHVFGRPPGSADLQSFTSLLDRGTYTQASLALLAADSAHNVANIDLVGLAASGLEYLPG